MNEIVGLLVWCAKAAYKTRYESIACLHNNQETRSNKVVAVVPIKIKREHRALHQLV